MVSVVIAGVLLGADGAVVAVLILDDIDICQYIERDEAPDRPRRPAPPGRRRPDPTRDPAPAERLRRGLRLRLHRLLRREPADGLAPPQGPPRCGLDRRASAAAPGSGIRSVPRRSSASANSPVPSGRASRCRPRRAASRWLRPAPRSLAGCIAGALSFAGRSSLLPRVDREGQGDRVRGVAAPTGGIEPIETEVGNVDQVAAGSSELVSAYYLIHIAELYQGKVYLSIFFNLHQILSSAAY